MKKIILNRFLFALIWVPILLVISSFENNSSFSTLIFFLSLSLYLFFILRLYLINFNLKLIFLYFLIGVLPMIFVMIGYFFDYNFQLVFSQSNILAIFVMILLILGSIFILVMSIIAVSKGPAYLNK